MGECSATACLPQGEVRVGAECPRQALAVQDLGFRVQGLGFRVLNSLMMVI